MKRRNAVLIVVSLLTAAEPATYHFSSSGDDSRTASQAGSPATPWQSLSKIATLDLGAGDSVLLLRGDTLEGSVELSGESGSSSDPIVIGAYGSGARPVVSGAQTVSGWSVHNGAVYVADVDTHVTQVFCDGRPIMLARFPNRGYMTIDSVVDNSTFIDGDFALTSDLTDAWVHIRTIRWTIESIPLASYDQSTNTFTLPDPTGYELYKDWGYLLNNALALLDTAGEWYYDGSAGRLYVWTPQGDDPSNHTITASAHDYGVRLGNCTNVVVQDLVVSGHSTTGVSGSGTGIALRGVSVLYPNSQGIDLSGADHVIEQDTVVGANHYGIKLSTTDCRLTQSAIYKTGMFYRMNRSGIGGMCCKGRALDFGGSGNQIIENRIDSTGYIAMGFAGPNSLIEKNWITNTCLTVDDGAGIYTWSPDFDDTGSSGTIIRNNIVVNSIGCGDGTPDGGTFANGIYMDDRIHHVEIYGNTSVGCDFGIFLHNNRYIDAYENICYDNRMMQIGVQRDAIVDQEVYGNTVKRNVMYRLQPSQGCFQFREYATNTQPLAEVDSNICCGEREARCDREENMLWEWSSSLVVTDSVDADMIVNGDFDTDIQNWSTWPAENARTYVADGGLDGGALRAEYTGTTDNGPLISSQPFEIKQDSTYELRFSAKGIASGGLAIVVRENHANWAVVGLNSSVTVSDAWENYSIIFEGTADEPDARVDFMNQVPDSVVFLDRISLYQVHISQEAYRGVLFTNESNSNHTLVLPGVAYRTVEGDQVTEPVVLPPYGSVVLIRESGAGSAGRDLRRLPGDGLRDVRLSPDGKEISVVLADGFTAGAIRLTDAQGRVVARAQIGTRSHSKHVSLRATPGRLRGVYLLVVQRKGGGVVARRVVVP